MRVAACVSNEVRNRSGRQRDNSPSNRTRREHECGTTDQGQVRRKRRVGEKGEKSRGRVEEEAAAAPRGPGTVTTARTTDGVSLATPASSPTASQAVDNTTADPANHNATSAEPTEPVDESPEPPVASEPPRQQSEPTSRDRTPLSEDASGGEVQEVAASHDGATGDKVEGGETDDEECRALERVDDKDSRVETSEDETTETTSASAPSASCDHPDEDAVTTDPGRPSRDPADAPDGDDRHPDEPTKPPDKTEGTGGRDCDARVKTEVSRWPNGAADATGEISDEPRRPTKPHDSPDDEVEGAKVGEVETSVLQASRGVQDSPGDGDDEERRPGVPDEPSDEPIAERRGPAGIQVEPGGETSEAERIGSVALESADAEVDGGVAGSRRDTEVEGESPQARREASVEGARARATAHARSLTAVEEDGQRTVPDDDDAPGAPPEPPPPLTSPDEPARQHDEPPSVELEGERRSRASCDDALTRADADASGASKGDEDPRNRPKTAQDALEQVPGRSRRRVEETSPGRAQDELGDPGDKADASSAPGSVEDVGNRPTKLKNTLKRVRQRSERRNRADSPRRARSELQEPSGETAAPGGPRTYQEGPIGGTSEDGSDTSASDRDTQPGGCRGEQVESKGTEGDSDRTSAINRAELDGIGPGSDRDERVGDTNPLRRDNRPGGQLGERVELGDVEGDRERQSDGEGDEMDGIRGGMDGARRDSKRVETTPLAEGETGQYRWRMRTTTDVPRPSTASTNDPRRPIDHPNPPRRRGRLKRRSTSISPSQWTYQVIQTRRGRIGRIGSVEHVVYGS